MQLLQEVHQVAVLDLWSTTVLSLHLWTCHNGWAIVFTLAGISRYRWSSSSTVATLDEQKQWTCLQNDIIAADKYSSNIAQSRSASLTT